VRNTGISAASGTVQVVEAPPPGMTVTALSGADWTFAVPTLTCTRTAPIAVNTESTISVTVSVAVTPPAGLTNSATVSGGADDTPANNTGKHTTRITVPDLTIAKSHTGNFFRGQTGAQYTLTVNSAAAPSVGTHTVVEQPPVGLTVTPMSGSGWTCTLGSLSCQNT